MSTKTFTQLRSQANCDLQEQEKPQAPVVYRDVISTSLLPPTDQHIPSPPLAPFPLMEKLNGCPCFSTNSTTDVLSGKNILEELDVSGLQGARAYLVDRRFMSDMFTMEAAELVLIGSLLNPAQMQRFFATGGSQTFGEWMQYVGLNPTYLPVDLKFDDTWNLAVLQPAVRYTLLTQTGFSWAVNIAQLPFFQGCVRPLLRLASYYNNLWNELGMAAKICEVQGINPLECTASSFGIDQSCPIQYSALHNQYQATLVTIFVSGEGCCPHYRIEKVYLQNGKMAFLPVQPVCTLGHSLTVPMFLPPAKPHFINESGILPDKFIVLTSHPEVIPRQLPYTNDCTFLSDYDLAGNLDRLPWEILRGKTVHYLLFTTPESAREKLELDLAIRACAKIRDAGFGHPRIIDCGGNCFNSQAAEIFSDNEFGRLGDKYGSSIDLRGFTDCRPPQEIPEGQPTKAFPYLRSSQLVEILGERGSGKTWCALLYALRLSQEDGMSVYFHGEGSKAEIRQRLQRLGTCIRGPEGEPLDGSCVVTVDLAAAPCLTDNGFDLKDPVCQAYVQEQLHSLRKTRGKSIATVVFDNYALLTGDKQEGQSALPVLRFLQSLQRDGLLVLLVCHTNSSGVTAASSHLERQANLIMKVSKNNPQWQQELRVLMGGKSGKDAAPTAEERLQVILNDINADEQERTAVGFHIEFTKIREGAQLNPRQIRINLEKNSLEDIEVDGEVKKAFAKGQVTPKDKQPVPDASTCARSSEEAYEAYVDIKGRDRDAVMDGLRKRVEGMQLQTRGELAQALGCSDSALDALLQQHDLRNTDIGLKSTPGRKRHIQ